MLEAAYLFGDNIKSSHALETVSANFYKEAQAVAAV